MGNAIHKPFRDRRVKLWRDVVIQKKPLICQSHCTLIVSIHWGSCVVHRSNHSVWNHCNCHTGIFCEYCKFESEITKNPRVFDSVVPHPRICIPASIQVEWQWSWLSACQVVASSCQEWLQTRGACSIIPQVWFKCDWKMFSTVWTPCALI